MTYLALFTTETIGYICTHAHKERNIGGLAYEMYQLSLALADTELLRSGPRSLLFRYAISDPFISNSDD